MSDILVSGLLTLALFFLRKPCMLQLNDLPLLPFSASRIALSAPALLCLVVWEGFNVVKTGRVMLGETNPVDSKPGTIRGDFCVQVARYVMGMVCMWPREERLCRHQRSHSLPVDMNIALM
ncbi:hypothetical protein NDU88_004092 [Pleurodeles waltl]|uniref:nucleoside-diphosphate kinase n=1 Tax=Pleurodeles waltl TaxID=8319 RepID=A0AAV7PD08_PLEWA|nr:hypothetical protein NDU88_004092 [Pleurodeles waltl]